MKNAFYIDTPEAVEILVSVLSIAFAFTIVFAGLNSIWTHTGEFIVFMVISVVTIGSGFVLHEMGHKVVAIYYGAYARFQMWVQGLLLMLLTSVLMGFLFAAPGAVYIYSQNITKRENGLISIAGPIVNVAIMLVFFGLSIVTPKHLYFSFDLSMLAPIFNYGSFEVWRFGAYLNFVLCTFNALPILPLDGSKIFNWSKPVWLVFVGGMFLFGLGSHLIGLDYIVLWFIMAAVLGVLSAVLFGRRGAK
jgi:Zn-dependent protease